MGEHQVREINTNMRDCLPLSFIDGHCKVDCLPLSFIDGHCKADTDRELFLLNLKGNISSSDGHKGMRGRKTLFPACSPSTISASMVFL